MSIASCGIGRDIVKRELYTTRETRDIIPISHAQLYRLIGAGKIDAVKIGRATYITAGSIERFLAELPAAKIRAV